MGVGAAFAVLIAIGIATTLLPAFLGLREGAARSRSPSRSRRAAGLSDAARQRTLGSLGRRRHEAARGSRPSASSASSARSRSPRSASTSTCPNNGSRARGLHAARRLRPRDRGVRRGLQRPARRRGRHHADHRHPGRSRRHRRRTPRAATTSSTWRTGFPDAGLDTAIIQVVPIQCPRCAGDQGPRAGDPRPGRRRSRIAVRHPDRRDRHDRRRDRHLEPAHERARAVRHHRRRPLDRAAHDRVPLGARADQGGARLPALGRRIVRRRRRGVPVGMARRPARTSSTRARS